MAKYDDIIQAAATRFNVDPSLIRGVIETESAGKPDAASSVGATGLMQIMPSNYKALGITDPKDPAQNIMGGTQLLSQLLDRYGDPATALRHYQGGDDQSQWGPVNAAYPAKVFSAGGIGAQQQASTPKTLPGIPVFPKMPQPGSALTDDAINAAFPGATSSSTTPRTPSDGTGASVSALSDADITAAFPGVSVAPVATQMPSGKPVDAPANPNPRPQPSKAQQAVADIVRPDFNDAMVHHLANLPLGLAQGFENGANWIAQKVAPGSDAAAFTSQLASQTNAGMVEREHQYQQQTPTNAYSTLGAAAGEGLGTLLGGGGRLVARGADLAGNALSRLGLNSAIPQGLARLLGASAGGATLGGAYGAAQPVVSPGDYGSQKASQIGVGAGLGALTPAIGSTLNGLGGYFGGLGASIMRPFTDSGRQQIAQTIVGQAARGGPLTLDLGQIVPGSAPTLAEATGNPGIATLQRTFRDINPSPFVAREQQNAAARNSLFANVSGDQTDIASAEAARGAQSATARAQVFANAQPTSTQPVVDAIDSILAGPGGKRPSVVTSLSNVRGLLTDADGQALPDADPAMLYQSVRKGINDMIDTKLGPSANQAGIQASRELLQVRDALDSQIDSAAPGFQQYLSDYADASKPIDAMRYLQGLNLTDQQGELTLAKVQGALRNLQKQQGQTGINGAKAVSQPQVDALTAIRDDLLRGTNTGLGRSAGSNTAQNLATQASTQAAFPGRLGAFAGRLPNGTLTSGLGALLGYGAGGAVGSAVGGSIGKGVGSGLGALMNSRNAAIQDAVTDLLLNPSSAAPVLAGAFQRIPLLPASGLNSLAYPGAIGAGLGALSAPRGGR